MSGKAKKVLLVFVFLLAMNAVVSITVRDQQALWLNVPSAPSQHALRSFFLGDGQMAYRTSGLMLQNLGDTGGRSVSFDRYNYDALYDWFMLSDRLDSRANFFPFLAAYYFSGTQNKANLSPLIDFLAYAGDRTEGQKWRWLAQAVFLARYQQEDFDKSLDLAHRLAAHWQPGQPRWMLYMPAFVEAAQGQKKAGYDLMLAILKEEGDNLDPAEINFMLYTMCHKFLDVEEAAENSLCISQK